MTDVGSPAKFWNATKIGELIVDGAQATVEAHYDADYFEWQSDLGMLGGQLNADKFSAYIEPEDAILDFGCGGGFLLASLGAAKKLGVEINDVARASAGKLGIETVKTLSAAPDNYFDVVISHHALEHTEAPLAIVRELRNKLKPGGTIVVVVPSERYDSLQAGQHRPAFIYLERHQSGQSNSTRRL